MCLMGGEGDSAVNGRDSRASALSSVGKGPESPTGSHFSISIEQRPRSMQAVQKVGADSCTLGWPRAPVNGCPCTTTRLVLGPEQSELEERLWWRGFQALE